jgi:hypothetical protein
MTSQIWKVMEIASKRLSEQSIGHDVDEAISTPLVITKTLYKQR